MWAFRVIGTVVMSACAVSAAAVPQQGIVDVPAERAVFDRFDAAVTNYLSTHRWPDVDLERLCLPDEGTPAAARLDATPPPREGDLLTDDVARLVRTRIAALDLGAARSTAGGFVAVGDRLVAGQSARVPRLVSGVLPRLPGDLAYRLAGADLVLVDLRTNTVIDALREWRG